MTTFWTTLETFGLLYISTSGYIVAYGKRGLITVPDIPSIICQHSNSQLEPSISA